MSSSGTASAIPENLYAYSGQCTQGAQELQDWVRTVLAPALQAYLSSASPQDAAAQTGGTTIDINAVTSRADSVQNDLPRQITAAYYTDQNVKATGKDFEAAGAQGALAHNACPPPDAAKHLIRTTDAALADTIDRSMLPGKGTDPAKVNAWWNSLSAADRQRLITEFPSQIGWLDGLPAIVRDQANRRAMEQEDKQLTAQLRSLEQQEPPKYTGPMYPGPGPIVNPQWEQWNEQVSKIKNKLAQIDALCIGMIGASGTTKQQVFLLGFDTNGNGHAIVAVGDPDKATNTVTYVPGFTSGVISTGKDDINRAANLWNQAASYASPGQKVSSIYWLNYNVPQVSDAWQVAGTGDAVAGAQNLAGFQAGLGAAHQPGVPDHTTVLGHSYGSLVVGEAAARDHLKPTDIVFVGSPGVGVDHASQLGISPSHVWAGTNTHDIIRLSRLPEPGFTGPEPSVIGPEHRDDIDWFGTDPATGQFGGQVFDANKDPDKSFLPVSSSAHSAYWDSNSSSLLNIAHIVVGKYGQVSRPHNP